ncbi:two-component response regulator 24-like [Apium graveolens]|uniref:two-component response regulator 24-like n=1 Tax=Apium graveolens TaxID=4045 RepID=UPI003D7912D9
MAKKGKSSNNRKLTALVVDDNSTIRLIHVAYLRRHEFETNTVENGRQAVDLIRSGEQFDAIFMDIRMPVMDGIQATRELRTMGVKSMIVGIDCELDSISEDLIQAGMDRVFEKPITHDIVISVRQAILNNNIMY